MMKSSNEKSLEAFWHFSREELLTQLKSNGEEGISTSEAKRRLKVYGTNSLEETKRYGTLRLLFSQFNTPFIYMLLFAAALSLLLEDNTDALIIFSIVVISALLSFIQERGAEHAMEKLLKVVQVKATVIRGKTKQDIPIEKLVPGDILELNAGNIIPGDCYLLEAKNLFIDEATLTGESFYTEKQVGVVPEDAPIDKRSNVLFMGTHVISGTAKAVVALTGKNTEFGKISSRLAVTEPETAFEHGVRHFGYFLMEVTFILLLVIFGFNIYFGKPVMESVLFALALAVGFTPQLLPAIIAINLAYGAKQMANHQVIVKKLASIENFGSMDILCADKTGTLTTGEVKLDGTFDDQGEVSEKVSLFSLLNSSFQSGYTNPIDKAITKEVDLDLSGWEKIDEVPYDFIRKKISVLVKRENEVLLITKGAFQQVVDSCSFVESASTTIDIQDKIDDLNKQFLDYCLAGHRVLAISYRKIEMTSSPNKTSEAGMTFLGFLVFSDPIKENIFNAITDLEKLGINLKIITGDNKLAAIHVASLLGISKEKVLTGPEMRIMSDGALRHQVNQKSIFAEIEPNQKERIVLALRKSGHVVGYLGDGINDVTALHASDVSISVDSATDAAKEVANIVLLEKDLSVLKGGVEAGRKTLANTLKYVFMASSANFGNMFSMAGASLFLSFLPMLPKQVLLTNLMTDCPEMTIATDQVDSELLQKPLRWNIHFIRKFMLIFGTLNSLADYATFGVLLLMGVSVDAFRTALFTENIITAALAVLMIRTAKPFYASMPSQYLLTAIILIIIATLIFPFTPLANLFGFTIISNKLYLFIGLITIGYICAIEIAKKIFLKHGLNR